MTFYNIIPLFDQINRYMLHDLLNKLRKQLNKFVKFNQISKKGAVRNLDLTARTQTIIKSEVIQPLYPYLHSSNQPMRRRANMQDLQR